MSKTKTQKGITLIALIITIVVLLILAVVTINAIKGDGIVQYAKNSADQYEQGQSDEQEKLNSYMLEIESAISGGGIGGSDETPAKTIAEAIEETMLTKTVNSDITDVYGNKITVPAGFKILVDETTVYTKNDISVTKGIVIQDKDENEFVWVPVGEEISDGTNTYKITLGRYESFVKNESGEYVPAQLATDYATQTTISSYWREDTADNHGTYKNTIAKSIKDFCLNSIAKGGYYIGRFEAGDLESTQANTERTSSTSDENTLVCKANQRVYNYVTQSQASSLSQNMYKDATTFTSDLINSYAWDTAIIFIQTFGSCTDYYNQNFSESFANTGINNDKYCNIYDMSGNAWEWSTETRSNVMVPCVLRGGYYDNGAVTYTSRRDSKGATITDSDRSFRPLLFL